MRLAIFLCLPIIVCITLMITSESLESANDLHTNTTAADLNTYTFASRPKIYSHVAPLAGLVTTLLVTLVMALQTHETSEIFIGMLLEAGVFINLFAFPPGTSMPQLTWILILLEAIGYVLLDSFFYILLLGAGLNGTQMGFLGKSPFCVATVSWVVGNGLSSMFASVSDLFSALICKPIPQSPSLPAPCTTTVNNASPDRCRLAIELVAVTGVYERLSATSLFCGLKSYFHL